MIDKTIDIPEDNPFKNDKFNRKCIAKDLTDVINLNSKDGFVLAIDSGWGTGKTTFIKMWEALLKTEDYKKDFYPVYYNAWENDYLNNPLLSMLKEIYEFEEIDKITKETLLSCIKKLPNVLSKVLSEQNGLAYISVATRIDAMKSVKDDLDIFKEIDNQSIALKKFKETLNDISSKRKIVFFIDELDRCRPTFAIELLETIKHLFSIKNIIFVISLDKEQLSSSIEMIYGQGMDSNGYLKRFFDLVYKLPDSDPAEYYSVITEELFMSGIDSDLEGEDNPVFFLSYFIYKFIPSNLYKFSLRDIDKLKIHLMVIYPKIYNILISDDNKLRRISVSFLSAYLLILLIKDDSLFKKIISADYKKSDIGNILGLIDFSYFHVNIEKFPIVGNVNLNNVEELCEKTLSLFLEFYVEFHVNPRVSEYTEDYNIYNKDLHDNDFKFWIPDLYLGENSVIDVFNFTSNIEI